MKNRYSKALSLAACLLLSNAAMALPNVTRGNGERKLPAGKTTAGTNTPCVAAQATIDLDINNVRARLMTGGDMWWDIGAAEARYEVPKGSKKHSLFAGSVWIGGYDQSGVLKVAAQSYRQNGNDYWPGPVSGPIGQDQTTTKATCTDWDRFWKVNKSDINKFRELVKASPGVAPGGSQYDQILEWPASGSNYAKGSSGTLLDLSDLSHTYAPFVDVNNDQIYDPLHGDYPGYPERDDKDLPGDQFVWWVFNDAGANKTETGSPAIGIEVQASAFAFSTNDFLNDATFYNYRIVNRSGNQLDSTYFATWTDADLGYAFDDYIGCDTSRGLGILYNGKSVDGNGEINSYGSRVPMIGIDFFIGPAKKVKSPTTGLDTIKRLKMEVFNYFNNDFSSNGNPTGAAEVYNYITGSNRIGQRLKYDFVGPGVPSTGHGQGPITNFVFTGDPGVKTEWSECSCNNNPDDRRFIHSAGPFTLEAGGVTNNVIIGAIWVADAGGCPTTSFRKIRAADDQAQDLFDLNFKLVEGPEAPTMVIREMDQKLVCYLTNDSSSNNYRERFGYDLSDAKYRVKSAKTKNFTDSLYHFEGYRIFQLRNSTITSAQIFNENGEVDEDNAKEVSNGSSDLKNGISRIVNYTNRRDIGDSVWQPSVKVAGKDSGVIHSFEITQDLFSTSENKNLVNYKTYYFIAIAYAYNDFTPFNINSVDSSQDQPYLGSAHGSGGIPIPVYAVMPNPQAGDIGNVLNSDYGSGVIIKRIEGTGNGGNALQMDLASEQAAINPPYHIANPTYEPGYGPVEVKVIDPIKVQPADWELFFDGPVYATAGQDTSKGIIATQGRWQLKNMDGSVTIYSDSTLNYVNEQILADYGISVKIEQQLRPGDDQRAGNGAIGNGLITSDITFTDAGYPWLAGVPDGEQRSPLNWIHSGNNHEAATPPSPCNYDDNSLDTNQFYENLLPNNSFAGKTWAPYALAAYENRAACGFGVAFSTSSQAFGLRELPSIDVVLTSDRSKWSRSPVIEMQDDATIAQGNAKKHHLRKHLGWNGDVDNSGNLIYSTDPADSGMSYFPGYAINQETGQRLNIVFGEDSWLAAENGRDMVWNPTGNYFNEQQNVLYGGKHYIYVLNSQYDEGAGFKQLATSDVGLSTANITKAYRSVQWVGLPMLNRGYNLKSVRDGIIPTDTRLRFRVTRPYARYVPDSSITLRNGGLPLYSFSTRGQALTKYTDVINPNKDSLLSNIRAVPNPYYAYAGYEQNRLDTRVRITNLPSRATINIFSLDGSLVRRIEKDNPNTAYIDWDIRNAKGLPVASGMYLIHVSAPGIGETVIKWFGAMRPVDLTTY